MPDADPFKAWLADSAEQLAPMIRETAGTVLPLLGDPDPKVALEVGYSLLLDKPLILAARPGHPVPERLLRAADAFLEWSDDPAVMAPRIRAAMDGILEPGDDPAIVALQVTADLAVARLTTHLQQVCPGPHELVEHPDGLADWCNACRRDITGDPIPEAPQGGVSRTSPSGSP